jgi:hypothetical protein
MLKILKESDTYNNFLLDQFYDQICFGNSIQHYPPSFGSHKTGLLKAPCLDVTIWFSLILSWLLIKRGMRVRIMSKLVHISTTPTHRKFWPINCYCPQSSSSVKDTLFFQQGSLMGEAHNPLFYLVQASSSGLQNEQLGQPFKAWAIWNRSYFKKEGS